MNNERVKMPTLDIDKRCTTFQEVNLGLTEEEALNEANRCLNCKVPNCVKGCPVSVNIPKFIECIKNKDIDGALKIINEHNNLPGVCGRVCPQEKQCEKYCVRGLKGSAVAIGTLERYVADHAKKDIVNLPSNGKKVLVIGSGPAGLTCAADLRNKGYEVTIYEALNKAGGVLRYGIPEFRLPKKILDEEIKNLEDMGVEILTNVFVGKSVTIDELKTQFDAIFISTGAGLPKFMDIKGTNYLGVYSANEILTRINLMGAYKSDAKTPINVPKRAVIVGGGNVALDAARSIKRLGNDVEVYIMYQRTENEMPARNEEIIHAKEEGIKILELKRPVEILGDDNYHVTGIKYINNRILDELDDSGRRKVEAINDSFELFDADMVCFAIGSNINDLAFKDTNLKRGIHGTIENELTHSSDDSIFVGGDVATGAATVISACGMGLIASNEIDKYLGGNNER